MNKDIRIATWNANGILNKREELEVFLHIQAIDICLLSETHFTRESYLKIRGYKTYHTFHPDNQARGGSAIIIKESINHYEECHIQKPEIQLTLVSIKSLKQNLVIGAAYCPPKHNLKMQDYKAFLQQAGERFIIGGDYNAKNVDWGSRLSTTKGKELRRATQELGCNFQSTGKPTYWPTDKNKLPDLLDFFIIRKISSNFIDIEENFDLNSDHSAAILTLSEHIIKKNTRPSLINKTTNWENFRRGLQDSITLNISLKTEQELDMESKKFMKAIQKAAFENTREVKHISKGNNYPVTITKLVSKKRKQRRIWMQSRDPTDKNILNNLSQKLKREIKKLKEESIDYYLQKLTPDIDTDYSLWKATRRINKHIAPIPPIRKGTGPWARDNKEKADLFASSLAEIFQPNQEKPEPESEPALTSAANTNCETIPPVTPSEVATEIKSNLNPKKAPGFDLITGTILKELPRKGILMLTYLINASFRLQYVPDISKVAEIIMIPKPGKPPNDVKSYRPISKLFE